MFLLRQFRDGSLQGHEYTLLEKSYTETTLDLYDYGLPEEGTPLYGNDGTERDSVMNDVCEIRPRRQMCSQGRCLKGRRQWTPCDLHPVPVPQVTRDPVGRFYKKEHTLI